MHQCITNVALLCFSGLILAAASSAAADPPPPAAPQMIFEQAVGLLFTGAAVQSAQRFDELVNVRPELAPELWQRGLALYYAGRYDDGRKQFELHRTVNPADVENPAWHYACVARATSPEQARQSLLPVGDDPRVPMREIIAFYRGKGTADAVLTAAAQGEPGSQAVRNQLCYAHLYLGLHAEAHADTATAKHHILLAAGPFSMNHFMGRVARMHAAIRGWTEDQR